MTNLEKIDKTLHEIQDELSSMALDMHANPELGTKEYRACALQTALLQKYGFSVEEKFCGIDTAYKACYKGAKPGPNIAMLAEYDALPDVGHACGHNLIAMVACGAGIAMREFADELGGNIYVIGCPGEESHACKVTMADAGAFDEMDVAMMSHPATCDAESLNTLAAINGTFDFYGKAAHASGSPEEGVNALDAVISCFQMIGLLRQQTKEDARIHGVITKGGTACNVIPDHTQALLCTRSAKIDYAMELFDKVCDCARGAALATGCRVEISRPIPTLCDTNSNKALTALNTKNVESLGLSLMRAGEKPIPGSSDMGAVTYRAPGIQTMFDITRGEPAAAHSIEFAEYARSEYALERALLCIKGHALTAIDLMTDPAHLEAIHEEFAKISKRPAKL